MNTKLIMALLVGLFLVGTVSAANIESWVPLVKDGQENVLTGVNSQGAVNLSDVSPVVFAFIRGQVPLSTNPSSIDKTQFYGEEGLQKALSAFPDDKYAISRGEDSWATQSGIFNNPYLSGLWGVKELRYDNTYSVPIDTNRDVLANSVTYLSSHERYLNAWANAPV